MMGYNINNDHSYSKKRHYDHTYVKLKVESLNFATNGLYNSCIYLLVTLFCVVIVGINIRISNKHKHDVLQDIR